MDFSSEDKLAASNFARWSMDVLSTESPILGNFAPPEAPNRTNGCAAGNIADTSVHFTDVQRAGHALARPTCGMCGYTAVPEDGRTCFGLTFNPACRFSLPLLCWVSRLLVRIFRSRIFSVPAEVNPAAMRGTSFVDPLSSRAIHTAVGQSLK